VKIGIIGSGYTGLSAAYYLSQKGHQVTVFEKEKYLAGLAASFKDNSWNWPLERFYHHIFPSDKYFRNLAQELNHPMLHLDLKTSIFFNEKILSFDNPISLLKFPKLSLIDKLRTAILIAILKITPFWQPLENISATRFIKTVGGQNSWKVLWEPLFKSKFGNHINLIPASWFWARIKKRETTFYYPEGGFDHFAQTLKSAAQNLGTRFYFNTEIVKINKTKKVIHLKTGKREFSFDRIIVTSTFSNFYKIGKFRDNNYRGKINKLKFRSTLIMIASLKKPFLKDSIYWLNINDQTFPFVGVVEHTNFINSKKYNSEHLIYIANYLDPKHSFFKSNKTQLIKRYLPYLQKINPGFNHSWINKIWVYKSHFAQPIITTGYSKIVPGFTTPLNGVYIANMQQVYPWDRQTNYAIKAGKEIAKLVDNSTDSR